jgi:hypothetical protein
VKFTAIEPLCVEAAPSASTGTVMTAAPTHCGLIPRGRLADGARDKRLEMLGLMKASSWDPRRSTQEIVSAAYE